MGAVGGHQVAGADRADLAGRSTLEVDRRPVRCVRHTDNLDAAVQAGRRPRAHVADEHRLQVILRYRSRRGRAEHGALGPRRHTDGYLGARSGGSEGLALQQPPLHLVAAGPDGRFEPPGSQQLHAAEADAGGPGKARWLRPALDEQHADTVPGQRDLARRLAEDGVLRDDVTVEEAVDVLWVLASFESFDLLFIGRGLTLERAVERLVRTAERALLRGST